MDLIKVKNQRYVSGNDAKYKFYRNKICSLTRISKKQYFFEYFQANINNIKKKLKKDKQHIES